MRHREFAKMIIWAFGIASGVVLLMFTPLIWQWLKSIPAQSATDPEFRKWFDYGMLILVGKWFLIDPITDKLRDIAWEFKELNQRERLKR